MEVEGFLDMTIRDPVQFPHGLHHVALNGWEWLRALLHLRIQSLRKENLHPVIVLALIGKEHRVAHILRPFLLLLS